MQSFNTPSHIPQAFDCGVCMGNLNLAWVEWGIRTSGIHKEVKVWESTLMSKWPRRKLLHCYDAYKQRPNRDTKNVAKFWNIQRIENCSIKIVFGCGIWMRNFAWVGRDLSKYLNINWNKLPVSRWPDFNNASIWKII